MARMSFTQELKAVARPMGRVGPLLTRADQQTRPLSDPDVSDEEAEVTLERREAPEVLAER